MPKDVRLRRGFPLLHHGAIVAAALLVAACAKEPSTRVVEGGPEPITAAAVASPPPSVASEPELARETSSQPAKAEPAAARPAAESVTIAKPATPAKPRELPAPSPSPADPAWDPLKAMADSQAKEASRQQLVAEKERKVREIQVKIDELEKRRLSVYDPFYPQPDLPPEEAQAWEGLSGPERIARVDGQIASARDELGRTKEELQRLKSGIY